MEYTHLWINLRIQLNAVNGVTFAKVAMNIQMLRYFTVHVHRLNRD
jgi:hypothetical protein